MPTRMDTMLFDTDNWACLDRSLFATQPSFSSSCVRMVSSNTNEPRLAMAIESIIGYSPRPIDRLHHVLEPLHRQSLAVGIGGCPAVAEAGGDLVRIRRDRWRRRTVVRTRTAATCGEKYDDRRDYKEAIASHAGFDRVTADSFRGRGRVSVSLVSTSATSS